MPNKNQTLISPWTHRLGVVFCLLSGGFVSILAQDANPDDWNELRRQARNRPRVLIYDNDGNDAMSMTELTAENFLDQRTTGFSESNVHTIFYCSNATFGMSTRPSRVWQERNWKDERAEITKGFNVQELEDAGLDSLQLVADFAHRHGKEIFSSIRMNDVHDHSLTAYGPAFFQNNDFKTRHPQWLLGTSKNRSSTAAWSAVDYSIPEVRDHLFDYAEEACARYDLDGLALDFFRHPAYFRSTFQGQNATEAELDAMTGLVGRIHEMLEQKGRRRGRPFLLSIRVPDSVEYCRALGLDVETWLRNQWIDLLVVSGYFQINDWQVSAELGHRYGVKVYGSLDEPRIKNAVGAERRRTAEAYRGRVSAALDAGLDGVSLFNFVYDDHSPLLKELGDPQRLRQRPQVWFAAARAPVRANGGNLPYASFQTVDTLTPDTPKKLIPGQAVVSRIRVAPGNPARSARRTLHLQFSAAIPPDLLQVSCGEHQLPDGIADGSHLSWDISQLDQPSGVLEIRATLAAGVEREWRWEDLWIREDTP